MIIKKNPRLILIYLVVGVALSYITAWWCAVLFYTSEPDKIGYQVYWITFSEGKEWNSYQETTEWYSSESYIGFAEIRDVNADYEIPFTGSREFGKVLDIDHTDVIRLWNTISLRALFNPSHESNAMILIAGWPFPCCYATVSPPLIQNPQNGVIRINLKSNTIYLPYRPLLIYLLLNSILYGAVLFAGLKVVTTAIQRHRLAKGLCPKCKYNLLGKHSSGCPECGWGREVK